MDTSTLIIASVIIVLCALPVFLLNQSHRNRIRKGKKTLSKLATAANTTIGEYHIEQCFNIAIDTQKKQLFFTRLNQEYTIAFKDIKKCTILLQDHQVGQKGNTYTVVDRIALALQPQQGTAGIELDFYNVECDKRAVADEQRLAEQWQKRINACL